MGKEELLIEKWRELTPQKQQQVLEFIELLKSKSETAVPTSDFVPQTALGKKLWQIRQRAISSGLQLLNEDEIEQELTIRRGGYSESKEDLHRLWCTHYCFPGHFSNKHHSQSNSQR